MTILTVVGARPQFIKAAPLSARLASTGVRERLVHTGQHYDYAMSAAFFDEFALPEPWLNLEVGSATPLAQTAAMLERLEAAITEAEPALVLVYGDTNSTLAGALAASKLHVPVAHVEAGLRSWNRSMPEEANRVVTDHLSSLLFCPSEAAVRNLAREGISNEVYRVGDLMVEPLRGVAADRVAVEAATARFAVSRGGYVLLTVHRAENTDDPGTLASMLDVLEAIELPVIFPLHPRTRARLENQPLLMARLKDLSHCRVVEPLSYGDTIRLMSAARALLTDSGGMQKEAYWLGVPCVTLRTETEWTETVDAGWNKVTGLNPSAVAVALSTEPPASRPALYEEDVPASAAIVERLLAYAEKRA